MAADVNLWRSRLRVLPLNIFLRKQSHHLSLRLWFFYQLTAMAHFIYFNIHSYLQIDVFESLIDQMTYFNLSLIKKNRLPEIFTLELCSRLTRAWSQRRRISRSESAKKVDIIKIKVNWGRHFNTMYNLLNIISEVHFSSEKYDFGTLLMIRL